MIWNIFSPIKRVPRRGKPKDHFDELINIIELFAPREHISEREMFYYNYKMMAPYRKPLLALLEPLSSQDAFKSDPGGHACTLFPKLKDFYDTKDTLSMEEALLDKNLIRRFRDLFVFFYGKKSVSFDEIEEWLTPLKGS